MQERSICQDLKPKYILVFFSGAANDQIASIPLETVFLTTIAPQNTTGSVNRFLALNSRLEECSIGKVPKVDTFFSL